MDEIVLSYYDSLLHRSDLELLDEGNWLNDRLIGLFYEYFDQELFQVNNNTFLFVNPSTVQYLKLCESLDEAKMCFLEPLGMDSKEVLFFPLNNNQSNVAGGSHWSLVVIIRSTHSLVHFDSTGSNDNEAKKFYNKYKSFFRLEKFFTDNKFPKQTNSSDCGVYLLGIFIFSNFQIFKF